MPKTCQFNDNGYCQKFDDDMKGKNVSCTEYMKKKKQITKDDILDVLDIIQQESKNSDNMDEKNGYDHSYAIVKTLLYKN